MPNICNYVMKVRGKKKDIQSFINIIESEYSYDDDKKEVTVSCEEQRHFCRIFNTSYDKDILQQAIDDKYMSIIIDGNCAWSVATCMTEEGYYSDLKHRYEDKSKATTLQKESETLDLTIEVFSEEMGVGFQEHYLYDKGKEIINMCVDYEEIYDEETEETIGSRGGFDWVFTI